MEEAPRPGFDACNVRPRPLNLRNCGRTTPGGVASPGQGLQRTVQSRSVPTIPTHYEVTLFKGDREFRGFGSNAPRFDGIQMEEHPGPGQYGERKAFYVGLTESVSQGIRGTGGFASRSIRFGPRAMPGNPRPGRGCPGPGAYDSVACLRKMKEHSQFSLAKASSSFAPADARSLVPTSEVMPGPGEYKVTRDAGAIKDSCSAGAAFKATGRGVEDVAGEANAPGPGEYPGAAFSSIASGGSAASSFKLPHRPKIARVHRDLPPVGENAWQVMGSFAQQLGKECVGAASRATQLPGPGQYNQDREDLWEGNLTSVAGSSAFQDGPKRTDWAPDEQRLLPGPGRYNPHAVDGDMLHRTDGTSCFKSGTDRLSVASVSAPGPAYYKPRVPLGKKSFRMKSATRQWAT